MINHVSIGVSNVAQAAAFYDPVLATLGIGRAMTVENVAIGYGNLHPEFWIGLPFNGRPASAGNGVHICFQAPSRAAVDAFHAAALAAGGTDEGRPGIREDYAPDYYAAFARDPDGNKIEAVCFSDNT
ncbi:MAG: VOC family protein [Alphaproteobacteria bacterium]|nr:VOC family protein [Alphaproteobacteria bacterium]